MQKLGVLYRQTFRSDGVIEVLQLVLPIALKEEVLARLHNEHGHEGVDLRVGLAKMFLAWNDG